VHRDQVYIPVLPEGFHNIGSSVHCPLQGVWKEGRVLTLQGHAEFDRFINTETVKVFGNIVWSEEVMRLALKAVDQDDDAIWAAGVLLRFFLESTEEASLDETVEDEIMARL
jgi:GMP synthase-like glutamine amidotransferase